MPELKIHEEDSLKKYGKKFTELHQWMDEPVKIMGRSHRKYRHDPNITPIEAKRMFGENADNACLDHILLDIDEYLKNKKEENSKKTEFSQQVSVRIPHEIMRNIFDYTNAYDRTKNITKTILFFLKRGIISLDTIEKTKKFLDEQDALGQNLMLTHIEYLNMKNNNPYLRTLERDNSTCRKCGRQKLDISPLDLPFNFNDEKMGGLSIETKITLCEDCKKELKNYIISEMSIEQFIEWYYKKKNQN